MLVVALTPAGAFAQVGEDIAGLDELWADLANAVMTGDFEALRVLYHPDALVVNW